MLYFFVGIILAGYSREIMNRQVYLQVLTLHSSQCKSDLSFRQFHDQVYQYIKTHVKLCTLFFFYDRTKEAQFAKYWIDDTEGLVRRFFVINIVSVCILILNDLKYVNAQFPVYMALRFGFLIPILIGGLFFGSMYNTTVKYRLEITAIVTILYGVVTLYEATTLALAFPQLNSEVVFDVYYSVGIRIIIFAFSGTGLRTLYSLSTAYPMTIAFLLVGFLFNDAPSISICLVAVIGFAITYTEERTRRIKFMLLFYPDEVLDFINKQSAFF